MRIKYLISRLKSLRSIKVREEAYDYGLGVIFTTMAVKLCPGPIRN
jgi:hypothetical protein